MNREYLSYLNRFIDLIIYLIYFREDFCFKDQEYYYICTTTTCTLSKHRSCLPTIFLYYDPLYNEPSLVANNGFKKSMFLIFEQVSSCTSATELRTVLWNRQMGLILK